MQVQSIVQQLLERMRLWRTLLSQHASGSAGVVGRQCARRPAWPPLDGDGHRTGVARWDESESHAIKRTDRLLYRIGTFMDSGSSTIRACVRPLIGVAQ